MQLVNIANLNNARSQVFALDNGKFAHVTYTIAEERGDSVVIEAQAFEIDAQGNNVKVATGRRQGQPSRTDGSRHVIQRSGQGDTHRLRPGWVRVPGEFNPMPGLTTDQSGLPEDTRFLDELPETAEVGDVVWLNTYPGGGAAFRWVQGTVLDIMEGKAVQLQQIIDQSNEVAALDL